MPILTVIIFRMPIGQFPLCSGGYTSKSYYLLVSISIFTVFCCSVFPNAIHDLNEILQIYFDVKIEDNRAEDDEDRFDRSKPSKKKRACQLQFTNNIISPDPAGLGRINARLSAL